MHNDTFFITIFVGTLFETYSKCRMNVTYILQFSTNFGFFNQLLSTQKVNVARFARNGE